MHELEAYKSIQNIAKLALEALGKCITPQSTEITLVEKAIQILGQAGVEHTWYYNTPALILLGSRSCLSVSGKVYQPAREPVGQLNLVTIDLSPAHGPYWGDCARSFYIENGKVTDAPQQTALSSGQEAEHILHSAMREFVTPDTRFCELFEFGRDKIQEMGFENLDFNGNLGHSIPTRLEDRQYIENNNTAKLSSVNYFTFEPHIRMKGGHWGFKHEEIYYFDREGKIQCL